MGWMGQSQTAMGWEKKVSNGQACKYDLMMKNV